MLEIKSLSKSDISSILDLENDSAPDRPLYVKYDEKALNFIFDNRQTCQAIGAFEKNQLIGWGSYRNNWKGKNRETGVFEISSIVVHKDHRKKGIGTKILNTIIQTIKQNQNFNQIYLTVSPLNTDAIILYLRNQFVINGFEKDLYGPGTDRVFLELKF